MRYARAVVVLAGALASFAFLLLGLREAFIPVEDMVFMAFPVLGAPVLLAAALVRTGRAFRIYAAAGVVAAVGIGAWIAASPKYGFPRSMLVLALTYAVAAALPSPGDRLPGWLTPAALVAGAAGVFGVIAPTLAWQERPDSLRVCARTPADADRIAAVDSPWYLTRGVEEIVALPDHPGCVQLGFESGVPQRTADRLVTRLHHEPTVTTITPA